MTLADQQRKTRDGLVATRQAASATLIQRWLRKINQNAEWQIELLDEAKRPVFRIALIAETLDK